MLSELGFPDWLGDGLKLGLPPGGVAVFFLWYIRWMNARHKNNRELRQDAVALLQGEVQRLSEECRELRKQVTDIWERRDKEVSDLKSELTAALVENGTLRTQNKHLLERIKELTKHNAELEERLEAEVARLQKGS